MVGVSFLCYKESTVACEVFFRQISKADYRGSWKITERTWSLPVSWQNVSAVKTNQGRHGGKVTCWVKQAGPLAKTETQVTWAAVSAQGYVRQLLKQISPRLPTVRGCQNLQKALACSNRCWSPFQWISPGRAPLSWSIQCLQEGVGSHMLPFSAVASAHSGFRHLCAPSQNNLPE